MGSRRRRAKRLSKKYSWRQRRRKRNMAYTYRYTKNAIPGMSTDTVAELKTILEGMRRGMTGVTNDLMKLVNVMEELAVLAGCPKQNVQNQVTEENPPSSFETNPTSLNIDTVPTDAEARIVSETNENNEQINNIRYQATEEISLSSSETNFTSHNNDATNENNAADNAPTSPIITQNDEPPINEYNNFVLIPKTVKKWKLSFEDIIDNTPNIWRPRIRKKPNALTPLETSSLDDENYDHPYAYELKNFQIPERQLKKFTSPPSNSLRRSILIEIRQSRDLKILVQDLLRYDEIAVNLFDHTWRSYQGFACLMLISTRDTDYLVDALSLRCNLQELNEVFTNPSILKIFHDADKKILWLQRDLSIYVVNMLDVEKAAKQLDFTDTSIDFLTKKYCDYDINKHYKLTDWRIRPLPEVVSQYAREHSHYLLEIKDKICNDLIDANGGLSKSLKIVYDLSTESCKRRFQVPSWNEEDCANLYKDSQKTFDDRQWHVFKELHRWRDTRARAIDESIDFFLPNYMLINVAENMPTTMEGIRECCGTIPRHIHKCINSLKETLRRSKTEPVGDRYLEEDAETREMKNNEIILANETIYDGSFVDKLAWLLGFDLMQEDGVDNYRNVTINDGPTVPADFGPAERQKILGEMRSIFDNLIACRSKRSITTGHDRPKVIEPKKEKEDDRIDESSNNAEVASCEIPSTGISIKQEPCNSLTRKHGNETADFPDNRKRTRYDYSSSGEYDYSEEEEEDEDFSRENSSNYSTSTSESDDEERRTPDRPYLTRQWWRKKQKGMNPAEEKEKLCNSSTGKDGNETEDFADNRIQERYDYSSNEKSEEEENHYFVGENASDAATNASETDAEQRRTSEQPYWVREWWREKQTTLKLADEKKIKSRTEEGLQQPAGQPKILRSVPVYVVSTAGGKRRYRVRKEGETSKDNCNVKFSLP